MASGSDSGKTKPSGSRTRRNTTPTYDYSDVPF